MLEINPFLFSIVVWATLVAPIDGYSLEIDSPPLKKWLHEHPKIETAIIWDDGNEARPWSSWDPTDQLRLERQFELASKGLSDEIPDPIPNQKHLSDNDFAKTVYAPEIAKQLFFASIAQSLAFEIHRSLGWSILNSPDSELTVLFDSRSYFTWDSAEHGYALNEDLNGLISFSSPRLVYQFLQTHGLIKSTSHETILHVLDWAKDLWHDISPPGYKQRRESAAFLDHFWHYRGFPPSLRVLQGTKQNLVPDEPDIHHWTAGCWGTVGLFIQIFRTLNIGVEIKTVTNHALPHFIRERVFLSHGDDPYSRWLTDMNQKEKSRLLIPDQKWSEFERAGSKSVGSQPAKMAVDLLLPSLVGFYCDDQKRHLSPEQGSLFAQLRSNFSLDELKKQKLWERLKRAHKCKALIN